MFDGVWREFLWHVCVVQLVEFRKCHTQIEHLRFGQSRTVCARACALIIFHAILDSTLRESSKREIVQRRIVTRINRQRQPELLVARAQ